MTLKDAIEEIPTFKAFASEMCNCCTANDWYCPSYCEELEKASKIPFEIIQSKYAEYDGNLIKVNRYIKRTKRDR